MGRTFFRRANLIDGVNPARKNATIVIEGERITAVATNGDAPKPAAHDTVYDLNGRSLMPGMVQCHYHVAYDNVANLIDLDLKHPPTYLTLVAARNADLLLRSGFTGAVGAGSLHNIDVTLKKAIHNGLIQGPRIPQQDFRRAQTVNALFIVPALRGDSLQSLFSTHPSTEERIRRLMAMQEQIERAGYLS